VERRRDFEKAARVTISAGALTIKESEASSHPFVGAEKIICEGIFGRERLRRPQRPWKICLDATEIGNLFVAYVA